MELPNKIEELVHRVVTCSSTKNCTIETSSSRNSKNKCSGGRKSRQLNLELNDSYQSDKPRVSQSMAISENGVGTSRIPEDISKEVR